VTAKHYLALHLNQHIFFAILHWRGDLCNGGGGKEGKMGVSSEGKEEVEMEVLQFKRL
jgi:hypothetical protein